MRCPGGVDTGDTCLSDAQIAAVATLNAPYTFDIHLASGDTSFPGYNAFISDLGAASSSPLQPAVAALAIGNIAPVAPTNPASSYQAQFIDNYLRYAIVGSPTFNFLSFGAMDRAAYSSRFSFYSTLDVSDRDLTAFRSKGGKALLMHGTEDMLITPRGTEFYVQSLQAIMGSAAVETFLRFYEVPGFAHSVGSSFNVGWDQLTALEAWVEKGVDPAANQIVTDTFVVPGRTRPLCLYPAYPRYKGTGDVNSAASFTCAAT